MLLGLIGVTIFGGTLPMTRLALEGFSPFVITFGRAVIASLAAGAILLALGRRLPRRHLAPLAGVGLGAVFGFPIFSTIAMQTIPASHGGVVLGILPLLTSIFAALVDGERPGVLFWACGIAGSALVVFFSARRSTRRRLSSRPPSPSSSGSAARRRSPTCLLPRRIPADDEWFAAKVIPSWKGDKFRPADSPRPESALDNADRTRRAPAEEDLWPNRKLQC